MEYKTAGFNQGKDAKEHGRAVLNLNWDVLSKNRSLIFGAATLSIVAFHYFEYADHSFLARLYLSGIGSIGVELFTLLSGIGLYFAYGKKRNLLSFFSKRFARVLLPYGLTAIPLLFCITVVFHHQTPLYYIKRLLFLTFWNEGDRAVWFISFILLMYLFYPVLDYLLLKMKCWYPCVIIATFAVIWGLKLWGEPFYSHCEIALWRVLSFETGVLFGKYVYEQRKMGYGALALIVLGFLFKVFHLGGVFGRLNQLFYGISLCLIGSIFFQLINIKWLNSSIKKVGQYSLEVYLIHVLLRGCAIAMSIDTTSIPVYAVIVLLTWVLVVPVQKLSKFLMCVINTPSDGVTARAKNDKGTS